MQLTIEHGYKIIDYLSAGGVIMIPLIALSLFMWLLIVNRAVYFHRLNAGRLTPAGALEYISEQRLPEPKVFRGAIAFLVREFLHKCTGNRELDRYILDETVVVITRSLDRYLAIIGVLAMIAPLLGLLEPFSA